MKTQWTKQRATLSDLFDGLIWDKIQSNRTWLGFENRFIELGTSFKDHYILMPLATAGVIGLAVAFNPVATVLTGAAVFLTSYKFGQAFGYFGFNKGDAAQDKMGEALADTSLLAGGFALAGLTGVMTGADKATRMGPVLHLVDEVAAGVTLANRIIK